MTTIRLLGPFEVAPSLDGFHTIEPAEGSPDYGKNLALAKEVRTVDAQYIVACLKLADAVPAMGEIARIANSQAEQYMAQRNALLAACREVLSCPEMQFPDGAGSHAPCEDALGKLFDAVKALDPTIVEVIHASA